MGLQVSASSEVLSLYASVKSLKSIGFLPVNRIGSQEASSRYALMKCKCMFLWCHPKIFLGRSMKITVHSLLGPLKSVASFNPCPLPHGKKKNALSAQSCPLGKSSVHRKNAECNSATHLFLLLFLAWLPLNILKKLCPLTFILCPLYKIFQVFLTQHCKKM